MLIAKCNKLADLMFQTTIDPGRKLHINLFFKIPKKESTLFYIHLEEGPMIEMQQLQAFSAPLSFSQLEQRSLRILITIFMLIAKCNKKWSMTIQGSIWFELLWVNSFPTNRFSPYKTFNNIPCMVFCQCIKLFLHCLFPIGLVHSLRIEIRYGNGKQGCKQVYIRKAIEIRWFRATTWPSTLWRSWIRSGGSSRLRSSSTELQTPLAYKLP